VAVADLNADGRPDLVETNQDGSVSIQLNVTAPGTSSLAFAAAQTFAAGPGPLAIADFNGDGRPDLAIADAASNSVIVLLNTTPAGASTLTFAAPQTFAAGDPVSIAAADLNGDGRPDLAVADGVGDTVSVLLNKTTVGAANVSFSAAQTFTTGTAPLAVTAADLNGDGRPDLAVTNVNNNTISVLVNATPAGAASAALAAPQTFAVGNFPIAVAAGDFNGDGRPDLVTANFNGGNVSVLVNTTAAGAATVSFATQQTFAVGTNPQALTVAGVAGNGRPDIAVVNSVDETASVLANTTPAGAASISFAAQQTFAVGTLPQAVAAGEFGNDGRPDLVVANTGGNSVSVLANTTTPLTSPTPTLVGQFGNQGVWEYSPSMSTWVQLTAAYATKVAADPLGDVVGLFSGYGVQLYRPGVGWRQINGVDATALAMDTKGDIVAEFPGYGVGEYLPASGWRTLTPSNASLLAMDGYGDVVGEFPGYGVQLYRPAMGWQQINGVDATLLAMNPKGDIAANFVGYGVGKYQASVGWSIVNGTQATALTIDAYGSVFAAFAGAGVGRFGGAAGGPITPSSPTLLQADTLGGVYGEFAGYGVWKYDPLRGWVQLTPSDVSALGAA
jgi:hypothetical protein